MVSQLTSPQVHVSPELVSRLKGLRLHLAESIKGQAHVTERVYAVLMRGELGLAHPRRPKGSWLFVGPTGVGKTETTKSFTGYIFEGAKPICFDMSEYQLQNSVEKLIGENRQDPGLFGRVVRGVSCGTLLFDEIEKAHPLVLDLLLQILEEGRITLATGEVLDLCGFYIVGTSNIGSEETMRMENAPFASVERTALMRVRERFRPELIGRLNEVLVFARLSYETQREICAQMVATEVSRLRLCGHETQVTEGVIELLIRQGYHRMLGARPMRQTVERFLQDLIVDQILRNEVTQG